MCNEHGYFRSEECPICGDEGKFLMSSYELESLGRIMAGILRHFPEKFGLQMDEEGFVDIYRMVSSIKRKRGDRMRWLRPTHIIGLVETDPKGRYQVENNHVRATYGHSIELSMSLPTDNIPERLYYPADPESVDTFIKEGLHPGDRTMVHLSKIWNDAYEAGIHREGPEPVILRIDAEDAQNNGIIIQRAGKTVFTVEEIPADFISLADEEDIELSRKEMMERGIDIDQEDDQDEVEEIDHIPDNDEGEDDGEEITDDDDDDDVEEDDLSDEDLEGEDDETDDDLDIEDDDMTDDDLDIEDDDDDS
ncbi:MAG: RNA 2'-phosphotransferase [Thermoplasmatota archaeon]